MASATAKAPSMKFRILSGKYSHGGKTTTIGDIVESDVDLMAKFGRDKFERLYEYERSSSPAAVPQRSDKKGGDGLDSMSLEELRKQAEMEEVEVSGLSRKEDLIKALRAASKT